MCSLERKAVVRRRVRLSERRWVKLSERHGVRETLLQREGVKPLARHDLGMFAHQFFRPIFVLILLRLRLSDDARRRRPLRRILRRKRSSANFAKSKLSTHVAL